MRLAFLIVAALALAGCVSAPKAASEPARPLILVGIDGFRADYLDRGLTPTLSAWAEQGAHAERMRPAFPSVTFPNHYTLVTGLPPGEHGVVGNTMSDPRLTGRTFTMANRAEATDAVWWDGATPIWVTAKNEGMRVATMFWPGSESAIRGVRPDYWLPFEQSVSSEARVNILLGWMSLPEAERPQFATLYFDIVDTAGHRGGPDSEQLGRALGEVDAALAKLEAGLKARGMDANIVVVADHGMAQMSPDRVILLDDIAPRAALDVMVAGAYAALATVGPNAADAERALLAPHPHFRCARKADLPAVWRYSDNPRISPIVCLAEEGWAIATRDKLNPAYLTGGAHGFDPELSSMGALFLAIGPDIRPGARLPVIDNVDVYPLLARLLGVTPEPNAGDASATAAALR